MRRQAEDSGRREEGERGPEGDERLRQRQAAVGKRCQEEEDKQRSKGKKEKKERKEKKVEPLIEPAEQATRTAAEAEVGGQTALSGQTAEGKRRQQQTETASSSQREKRRKGDEDEEGARWESFWEKRDKTKKEKEREEKERAWLLYKSDAAEELTRVDLVCSRQSLKNQTDKYSVQSRQKRQISDKVIEQTKKGEQE